MDANNFDFSTLDEIPDPLGEGEGEDSSAAALPAEPKEKSSTRGQLGARRGAALLAAAAWILGNLLVLGLRGDLAKIPLWYLGLQVGLPVVVGLGAGWLVMRPGKLGLGVNVQWVAAAALAVPALFWLVALVGPAPHSEGMAMGGLWQGVLACCKHTLVLVALPIVLAAVAFKGSFATASRWRGAVVGGVCGVICGATMNLACANPNHIHVALGHGIPAVLMAIGGALLVGRAIRI